MQSIVMPSGIEYLSCKPVSEMGFEECLTYLKTHTYDTFMHKHLLEKIGEFSANQLKVIIERTGQKDQMMRSLLYEACLFFDHLDGMRSCFPQGNVREFTQFTPLIYIKSSLMHDQDLHSKWVDIFSSNIWQHRPIPKPDTLDLPWPFTQVELEAVQRDIVHVRKAYERITTSSPAGRKSEIPPKNTAQRAVERLQSAGVLIGEEERNPASLSKYALQQKWQLSLAVKNGRHDYRISGVERSYGRGLSIWEARAGYAMETIELFSAFANFGSEGALDYVKDYPLIHGRHRDLVDGPVSVLNPNNLCLEVPYENEYLYWIEAETYDGCSIRIPAQCVFLLCNLDEICLGDFRSTGLAAGNTVEEAKVSALLEVVERDADAVMPYDLDLCFTLESYSPQIASLLTDYRSKGIQIQFQDISPKIGIPCYRCFVIKPEGKIATGAAAHLDGKRAIISAMTETPYPYEYGSPSAAGLQNIRKVFLEDLPNYSAGSPEQDLAILEETLAANGYPPIYTDLTREDLNTPVVKALIPGMAQPITDFPLFFRFSRVNVRLFSNFLKLFQKG
jgi:ribosomal protein S12 methylthiotransferase accessory factor